MPSWSSRVDPTQPTWPPTRTRNGCDTELSTGACSDRVRLVGRVGPDGAAALMRAADLVLAVPWYEPFGIVPLEAMACGTPVVASAVGGMLDTVRPGVTGAHVPPRDPHAVAAAVRDLLADRNRLRDMGIRGTERVRQQYSWSGVAAQTEATYGRLVHPESVRDVVPASTLPERKS